MGQENDEPTQSTALTSSPLSALAKHQNLARRGLCDLEAAEKAEALSSAVAKSEKRGQGILVIDHEQPIREIIDSMLTSAGYRCKTVSGGIEAFALLDSGEKFDLLTTDLLNTPMDGIGVLETAKRRFPDIPVVIVSAVKDPSVTQAAIGMGAYEFLNKPFEREELLRIVRRAVGPPSSQWGKHVPADEQFKIGEMYYDGTAGFPQDFFEALGWFRLAAEQGHADAQNNVGAMYQCGEGGLSQDYEEAMRLYRLAAEQGHPGSKCDVGLMYMWGQGVSKDYAEAVKWYRQAAERGDALGQFLLGRMYYRGDGIPLDYAEALHWYRLSAQQGSPNAQFSLGMMYDNGQGVSKDYAEAVKWYRQAAEHGQGTEAQYNLGVMYKNGLGIAQDAVVALMWFSLASDGGDKDAGKQIDALAGKMTDAQIAEGQLLAREWKPKK